MARPHGLPWLDDAPIGVIGLDLDGRVVRWNPAAAAIFGHAAESVLGQVPPEPTLADAFNAPTPLRSARLRVRRPDSQVIDLEATITSIGPKSDHAETIGYFIDVTDRERLRRQLDHQADHDSLTGLPNRKRFLELLTQALNSASPHDMTAVLVVSLDRLHDVTSTLGNAFSDQILVQISRILPSTVVRDRDILARVGCSQFALLLPNLPALDSALNVAARIQRALARPVTITLDGLATAVDTPASIGVAAAPADAEDAPSLLRRAVIAMEQAATRSDHIATPNGGAGLAPGRLETLAQLRQALTQRELTTYYQPKIDVATGRLRGVEALARWIHPDRGMIPPSEFIPLAERAGLITHITYQILNQALSQASTWNRIGHQIPVAVNLSASCLHQPTLFDNVRQALLDYGVAASQLCLEITETALMQKPDEARKTLSALADLGIRLSLDDFGTGYSSLAYLRHLPVAELKIDRAFIADMTHDDTDTVVLRAAIDLGHNLGLSVVAEGVEDAPTLDALNSLGCDLAQGFHIARPMPAEEATTWIAAHV